MMKKKKNNEKKNFIRRSWKTIVFSLSILLFVIITRLLLKEEIHAFDDFVYKIVTYYNNDFLIGFFKFISFLCSTYFIIFMVVILMLFIKNKKMGFFIGLNVLICFLLNQSMKLLFARNRPVDINLIIEDGYSFPSGHSMVSLAFYGFIIYIVAHKDMSRFKRLVICSLLALLVLLIGISRIYLGVHFASDVLAGFAISMAYLIIFIKFSYKKIKE